MEKTCNKCSETKLISEFHKRQAKCKICQKEINKNWILNNPEYIKENSKKWYLNNLERKKETIKNWRLNNPERCKEIDKKYRYKISAVYGIYDNNDTLLYVGQSKQLNGRINKHKGFIKNPAKALSYEQPLYYALNKCKSVYFTTIEECSPTALLERETHYITQLKPLLNKLKNEN
jgi:hypothetical protein